MSAGHHLVDAITEPGRPETQEVADGVFAYIQPDGTWWINNTGFLVGPRASSASTRAPPSGAPAPSCTPIRRSPQRRSARWSTPTTTATTRSATACSRGATIVGHERAREEVIAFGPPRELPFWAHGEWGDLTLDPPFLTFTDSVTVLVGDLRAELRHVGTAAHTTNDVIAWLPEQSVLFCGDLVFNGGTPFLLMGSVAGRSRCWRTSWRRWARRRSCPGTGRCFRRRADRRHARLPALRARRRRAGAPAGVSPLDAARDTDLGRFADWPDAERIVGNLYRAYAELGETPRGGPIDVFAALGDMVAYNGGRP